MANVTRKWLLGIAALVVMGGCARKKSPTQQTPLPPVPVQQPVYQGQPLSYWVIKVGKIEEYNGAPEDAVAAIRAIGSNAAPFLLNWMPSADRPHDGESSDVPDWQAVGIAWWALGSEGESAIPVLARTVGQPPRGMDDYSVWTESAKAISYLGPEAIAPMLTAATNLQGRHELWELIHNFENLGSNGAPAVPAIIHWAKDPDNFVRDGVVSALGGIGERADLALPVILNTLEHDADGMVRRDAAEALGAFAKDSDAVLPELIKTLKDPDWQARGGALSGLGKMRDKPDVVIPLIVPFLSDGNSVIVRSAGYALIELNCRSAYDALVANGNPNIGDIVYQAGQMEKARRKRLK